MEELVCSNCGSVKFHQDEDGTYTCDFCETKYFRTKDGNYVIDSTISLREDVSAVLKKWEKDPVNGKKYAQVIIQIDPNNKKAREELAKNYNSSNNSSNGCYVATCVYGSYDCPEVWTLRRFRDNDLAATWAGRVFIRLYYAVSPTLVSWFGNTKWFKHFWRFVLDRFVLRLRSKGFEDTPYEDIIW